MPAGKFLAPDGNLRRQAGFAAVKIDIVVAAAVHFCKFHIITLWLNVIKNFFRNIDNFFAGMHTFPLQILMRLHFRH